MSEYASLADFKMRAGYEIDGVWYPRVTSIVSIKAKPALYRYYAGMPSFAAADQAKDQSAQEGSRVHDAIEAILRGHEPIMDETTQPAVEAFTEFSRNTHIRPLLIEERLISRVHRYAGTVDVVAEVDGVVGVLDIKTSKAVYRDYGMQTAAYAAALLENPSLPQPVTSWILRLDQCRTCSTCGATLRTKGGTIRVRGGSRGCRPHQWEQVQGQFEFVQMNDQEQDLAAFLAAKALWQWEYRDYLLQLAASV
jgi:hypothetical protein